MQTGWDIIRRALLAVGKLGEQALREISRRHADAGKTAYEALLGQTAAEPFSLAASAAFFADMQRARGPLAKTGRLQNQLARVTAAEGSYLVRILTGDLRIGLKSGLVEEALATAFAATLDEIREAHMLTGDLGETALRAQTGTLAETKLRLFHPIQPMLASPEPSAEAIWTRIATSRAWAEDKYDGIRAQLPIGKAYSGLTDQEIEELTAHFTATTTAQRGQRREVRPEIGLEIAFDSIQPSARHASGLALRFPRIKAIRRDKKAADIDTLAHARSLVTRAAP